MTQLGAPLFYFTNAENGIKMKEIVLRGDTRP